MGNILLLVHRLPYPPNKGDKVRSYHLLRHLQQRHRVFLGTFIDDPQDEQHVSALRALCPDLFIARIDTRWRKLASLTALLTGEPMTLVYYRHTGLHRWVTQIAAQHPLLASVVFSSGMAPYARMLTPRIPMLIDFVDVDSAKWTEYTAASPWPINRVYRREGKRLQTYEHSVAADARRIFFVTAPEVALFTAQAPELRDQVQVLGNGVDSGYFRPEADRPNPFAADERPIVFTGTMDYWPNVDAVSWFAKEVLPRLRKHAPQARLYVVGRNPTPQVRALAGPSVSITGAVQDTRPYLQHAAAVVAPMRVVRGIQNKVLEAMAMAQPVVTVTACADVIANNQPCGLLRADDPEEMLEAVSRLIGSSTLRAELGRQARTHVEQHFRWGHRLAGIDAWLESTSETQAPGPAIPAEMAHG